MQKIRSIVATAALAAGVGCLSTGPASADSCATADRALLSSTAIASYCDRHAATRLRETVSGSGRFVTDESVRLAMAAGELARDLGLTGLAAARPVLGTADLGGVAATWGMPALTSASPAGLPLAPDPRTLKDLSTAAGVASLPMLPQVPEMAETAETTLGVGLPEVRFDRGVRVSDADLESPPHFAKPVQEIGEEVMDVLLPKAMESVEGTSTLVRGVTAIAPGLGAR
ncbi:hypothetical protein C1J01_02315 [Nonomuraea aridisoli]|uniref:Uncharacterized protein n=1 Tax=Nonomuraea aridisoli TaxID=2070368 RepID=A0A2W2FMD3_9ACTN|nr:hypothetical protein C1J01_02315 [Nonomuraea aridisoli]